MLDEERRQSELLRLAQEPETPFELVVLEHFLQEVCTAYQRRVHIFSRVATTVLSEVTQQTTLGSRADFYKLVPIRAALKEFELSTLALRGCLADLLGSDEDLLALLLTERRRLRAGEHMDPRRHEAAELLLENYHRQARLLLFAR
ncbi:unnamed protein product [Phaeothamnion confervicola]